MSLVSQSHVELVRARKALEKAFIDKDWEVLSACDRRVGEALNDAFEDDRRDTRELVYEMERVLGIYAKMVSALPASFSEHPMSFIPK